MQNAVELETRTPHTAFPPKEVLFIQTVVNAILAIFPLLKDTSTYEKISLVWQMIKLYDMNNV